MADWTAKVSPRESYFITRQGSGDNAVMLEERRTIQCFMQWTTELFSIMQQVGKLIIPLKHIGVSPVQQVPWGNTWSSPSEVFCIVMMTVAKNPDDLMIFLLKTDCFVKAGRTREVQTVLFLLLLFLNVFQIWTFLFLHFQLHFISHKLLWLCHWSAKNEEDLEYHLMWKRFVSLWRSRRTKSRVCGCQFFGIQASLLLWHHSMYQLSLLVNVCFVDWWRYRKGSKICTIIGWSLPHFLLLGFCRCLLQLDLSTAAQWVKFTRFLLNLTKHINTLCCQKMLNCI